MTRSIISKKQIWNIVFGITLIAYTIVMFILFYRQTHANVVSPTEIVPYISDMPDYLKDIAGESTVYSFPYRLFFWISQLFALAFGVKTGTAIAVTLLNSFSVAVTWMYFRKQSKDIAKTDSLSFGNQLLILIFTYSLYFIGCLCAWKPQTAFGAFDFFAFGHRFRFYGFNYWYRCQGVYTPNPIWNATYLATRPFAIVAFFESVRILDMIKKKSYGIKNFCWKESIPFAVALFLTTFTKPSYTLILLPSILVCMLVLLAISKGKCIKGLIAWCITMIPTGIILLYEFGGVFAGANSQGEETGIGLSLGAELGKVWKMHTMDIRLSILLGMALPIGVLLLNIPELVKNKWYGFAWLNYLFGIVMFLCLYEKGFRMSHANFSWGYMHGMFFVYLMTFVIMIKNTKKWIGKWKVIFLIPEWGVFVWHMACGLQFFCYIYGGGHLGGF